MLTSVTFTAVPSSRTTPKGGYSRQVKNAEKSSRPLTSKTAKHSGRSTPRHDPHKGKTVDLSSSRRDDVGTGRNSESSQSSDAISSERQSSRRSDPSRERQSSRSSSKKPPTKIKSTERPAYRGRGDHDEIVKRVRHTPEDREIERAWQAQAYREWAREVREEDRLRKKAHMRGVIRSRVELIKENTSKSVGSIVSCASACDVKWVQFKEAATQVVETEYQGAINCWHDTPSLVNDMAHYLVNCATATDTMDESDTVSMLNNGDENDTIVGDASVAAADSKVPVPDAGLHSAKSLILACRVPSKDVVDESVSMLETSSDLNGCGLTQMTHDQVQKESTQDPVAVTEKTDEGDVPTVEPSLDEYPSSPGILEMKIEKETGGNITDKNELTSIVSDNTAPIDIRQGPDDEGRSEPVNASSILPKSSYNSTAEDAVEASEAADHKAARASSFFIQPSKIDRGGSWRSRNDPPELEDERNRTTIPNDASETAPIVDDTSGFHYLEGIVLHTGSLTRKSEEHGIARNEYKLNPSKDQQPSNVPRDEQNTDSADRTDISIRVSDSLPKG